MKHRIPGNEGAQSCIFLSLFRLFVASFISLNGNGSCGLPGDRLTFAWQRAAAMVLCSCVRQRISGKCCLWMFFDCPTDFSSGLVQAGAGKPT